MSYEVIKGGSAAPFWSPAPGCIITAILMIIVDWNCKPRNLAHYYHQPSNNERSLHQGRSCFQIQWSSITLQFSLFMGLACTSHYCYHRCCPANVVAPTWITANCLVIQWNLDNLYQPGAQHDHALNSSARLQVQICIPWRVFCSQLTTTAPQQTLPKVTTRKLSFLTVCGNDTGLALSHDHFRSVQWRH